MTPGDSVRPPETSEDHHRLGETKGDQRSLMEACAARGIYIVSITAAAALLIISTPSDYGIVGTVYTDTCGS